MTTDDIRNAFYKEYGHAYKNIHGNIEPLYVSWLEEQLRKNKRTCTST